MDLGEGPVTCVGARTQWHLGGALREPAREVRAPAGVIEHEPAEMVVRVGAGTSFAELDAALAPSGQMVPLDPPATASEATIGGLLAVGHSGMRRLRYGPIRDTLLEARIATAGNKVVKAGGPVVKNVTGYDLCRLLVGSFGTLGFLAEVVLRCHPRPRAAVWLEAGDVDPFAARDRLFRPSSVLWDGMSTWVLLEGRAEDVRAERERLGSGWDEVAGPPTAPAGGRESYRPSGLRALAAAPLGTFLAEIGVGTVHRAGPVPAPAPDRSTIALHEGLKQAYDPDGRLNPGRRPW